MIRTLLDIPLWQVANLDQPSGIGDKKILREVGILYFLFGHFPSIVALKCLWASNLSYTHFLFEEIKGQYNSI